VSREATARIAKGRPLKWSALPGEIDRLPKNYPRAASARIGAPYQRQRPVSAIIFGRPSSRTSEPEFQAQLASHKKSVEEVSDPEATLCHYNGLWW
jgi:hypothetical protein